MLARRQILPLLVTSLVLWGAATLTIRLFPAGLLDPLMGDLSFATTILLAWISIRIIRWAAHLSGEQLLGGVALVGAIAMMFDGAVLRWAPSVYGSDDLVVRLGAAWLLWGYGVSLALALFMASAVSASAQR